ncbi:hypothetical protein APX70_01436, partial [Pseudomonas syringae pv. maculicola]
MLGQPDHQRLDRRRQIVAVQTIGIASAIADHHRYRGAQLLKQDLALGLAAQVGNMAAEQRLPGLPEHVDLTQRFLGIVLAGGL